MIIKEKKFIMPFIDSKITGKVSTEKKEAIKTRLGQMTVVHKLQ